MKLIIDIPEETKEQIIALTNVGTSFPPKLQERIVRAIANGTLLPKEHGKLIILSEDAIKREQTFLGFSCQRWISDVGLSNATVAMIEADKGSEEK